MLCFTFEFERHRVTHVPVLCLLLCNWRCESLRVLIVNEILIKNFNNVKAKAANANMINRPVCCADNLRARSKATSFASYKIEACLANLDTENPKNTCAISNVTHHLFRILALLVYNMNV